jgi:hypothetical protein
MIISYETDHCESRTGVQYRSFSLYVGALLLVLIAKRLFVLEKSPVSTRVSIK